MAYQDNNIPVIERITLPSGNTYYIADREIRDVVDALSDTIAGGVSYIIAWDGTAAPVVANVPEGVEIEYNGTTYNVEGGYNGLADVIKANANEAHELDVTAVWECSYFDGFKLAIRTDTEDETTIWLDSEHQIDTDLDSREGYTTINFVDNDHENSYSLEQNVMTAYYNKVIREHVYAGWDGKFYDNNGVEAVWGGDFKLYISGNLNPVGGEGNTYNITSLTFERLMTLLASDNSYSNGLEGKTVTIILMFD